MTPHHRVLYRSERAFGPALTRDFGLRTANCTLQTTKTKLQRADIAFKSIKVHDCARVEPKVASAGGRPVPVTRPSRRLIIMGKKNKESRSIHSIQVVGTEVHGTSISVSIHIPPSVTQSYSTKIPSPRINHQIRHGVMLQRCRPCMQITSVCEPDEPTVSLHDHGQLTLEFLLMPTCIAHREPVSVHEHDLL